MKKREDINNAEINVKHQKRIRNINKDEQSIMKRPKFSNKFEDSTSRQVPDEETVESGPLLTKLDNVEEPLKNKTNEGIDLDQKIKLPASKNENHTEKGTKIKDESRKANFLMESVYEILSLDYKNMCTRLNESVDHVTFVKDCESSKNMKTAINVDYFISYMTGMKENVWQCVLPGIITRFSATDLAPTIVIRCLFHLILKTSNSEWLEHAVTAISSYWLIHRPTLEYTKIYYHKLLMETEDLPDYPASVKGKMFNEIFNNLISALLDENFLKPLDDPQQTADYELNDFDQSSKNSEETDDEVEEKLPPEEQLNRLVTAFTLLMDLLEMDFAAFLMKNKEDLKRVISLQTRQPFIVKLKQLPDLENIVKACVSCKNEDHAEQIFRYINLCAEVTRVQGLEQEDRRVKHPYFSQNCVEFATRLLGVIMQVNQTLKDKLRWIEMCPTWLQMLMYCRWITDRVAITADPSLMYVVKLLKLCSREIPSTQRNVELDDRSNLSKSQMKKYENILHKHNINKKKLLKRSPKGETKLMEMCRLKKENVVTAILSLKDIDVNAACNAGWTVLHEATNSGLPSLVRMLLDYKPEVPNLKPVNIFASNPNGITALHDVAKVNNFEICQLLVEKGGAKLLEMEMKTGETAMDLTSNTEIKEYFKQVLINHQTIDYRKTKVLIDLEILDLVLLRKLTLAVTDVYCLHEIKSHNKKLKKCTGNTEYVKNHGEAQIKADYTIIHDNIKALKELKMMLKGLAENQDLVLKNFFSNWLTVLT